MEKSLVNVDQLLRLPWTSCDIEGQKHIIKYLFQENSYKIMLSDLKFIYCEELNEESLLYRSKEMNSSVEIIAEKISEQLHQTIKNFIAGSCIAGIKLMILNKDSNHLVLKSESLLSGIPFAWQFNLTSMDSAVGYGHLVNPLAAMVLELKRRNYELIKIIKQKDEELGNHKTICSQLVMKTNKFNETAFIDKMNESMIVFNSISDISSTFQDQLFLKIASSQSSLVDTVNDEEPVLKKPCISEVKSNPELQSSNADVENTLKEEMNRRQLLQQQQDLKRQKKFKKKPVNF